MSIIRLVLFYFYGDFVRGVGLLWIFGCSSVFLL